MKLAWQSVALCTALGAVLLRGAWAQTGTASSAADNAALKKFEEGKKAYDGGKFEEALIAFQASISMLPSPNSRLYIARCQRAIGRVGSAYVSYKLAIREATDRLNATGEKRFKATRDAAASEIAEIEDKVPRVTLTVPSDVPDGFSITLDGVATPKEAWGTSIETDPGTHTVVAEGPRRRKFAETFDLKEGEQRVVKVAVERIPSGTLSLSFASKPSGLSVHVDGAAIEASKIDGTREVDVGKHTVTATAPGYLEFRWAGDVRDLQETKVDVKLAPRPLDVTAAGTPKWLMFTVGGAAVACLGVGTMFAIQAQSAADAETAKDPLERSADERDRVKGLSTRANILFVTGGVLAVGAAVLVFTTRWSDPGAADHRAMLSPWIGVNTGGLAAWGRF